MAIGMTGFSYPPEVGLPIGGPNINRFYRLEMHYVNSNSSLVGKLDNSALLFRMLPKPRKYDAGSMELGMPFEDRSAIPPGQTGFPFTFKCDASCTAATFPPNGITIFAGGFHAHSHGQRMILHRVRNGTYLEEVLREDYYSERSQEYRLFREPIQVMPVRDISIFFLITLYKMYYSQGDTLIGQCYYDTTKEQLPVVGGLNHTNEMCLHYIVYYPAVSMVRCKSHIANSSLDEFFEIMKE